jgi:hypothetical protein
MSAVPVKLGNTKTKRGQSILDAAEELAAPHGIEITAPRRKRHHERDGCRLRSFKSNLEWNAMGSIAIDNKLIPE